MAMSTLIKSLEDIMRKDAGLNGDAQYIEQITWLLFLKAFDAKEMEWEFRPEYRGSTIPEGFRWRDWADDKEGITGDALIKFVDELFDKLKKLDVSDGDLKKFVIRNVFTDINNYMKSGIYLRQLINRINEKVDFIDATQKHTFNELYGKKGTGKSAIYRMIEQESLHKGCLVINKDFGEFPFEKLLSLQDDNFAKPNQYQTIWRNVIFNLFIQAIASLPDEDNDYYREIKAYKEMYLGNALDLHKEIISKAVKSQGSLLAHGVGVGVEKGVQCDFRYSEDNITTINSTLSSLLENYFKTTESEAKIVVQFDRFLPSPTSMNSTAFWKNGMYTNFIYRKLFSAYRWTCVHAMSSLYSLWMS